MCKKMFLTVILILILAKFVSAETIVFKSGNKEEGTITEMSDNNITIKSKKVFLLCRPKDDKSFYVKGLEYTKEGKYKEASSEFSQVVERSEYKPYSDDALKIISDTSNGVIKNETGQCLFNALYFFMLKQDYNQAAINIQEAIKIGPGYAYSYDIYARCFLLDQVQAAPQYLILKRLWS